MAVERTAPNGRVVAVDLLPMDPLPGAAIIQGDFQDDAVAAAALEALGGPADGVLHDGVLQEIDIRTGRRLFEWRARDHVRPDESYAPLPGGDVVERRAGAGRTSGSAR